MICLCLLPFGGHCPPVFCVWPPCASGLGAPVSQSTVKWQFCCWSGSVVVRVSFSAHRRFLFHSVDPRCRPGCGSPRGGLGTQLEVPVSPYVGGAVV